MASLIDPFRDPIHDRRGHEAGHLAGLRWFGYTADLVQLDLRWADFGTFGHIERIRRTTGDPEREPHDRAVIAALGPVLAGVDLDHHSAATDARTVDANWADGWPLEGWRFISTERARDLAKHAPFNYTWRLLVVALADLGERFVELRGDEVDAFITEAISPGTTSFHVEEPRLEAAASAGAPGSFSHGGKAADAALRTPEPSPGVLRSLELV